MRLYLACFDIQDDRVRRKICKILLRTGDRVQHSVFEISLKNERDLDRLREECLEYLEPCDDLRFYWSTVEGVRKSIDATGNPLARYPAAILL